MVRSVHACTPMVRRNKPRQSVSEAMKLDESIIYRLATLMAWISQKRKRVPV
jgi:hypothetical protein